ncbi:MAG TPA: hypothetical protein PLF40_12630, partial [Kofleriaceae bacterium]|nr:hypothetical protein [Kofleriaceae bacterium]
MNATCHRCGKRHDLSSMGYRSFACSCGAMLEASRLQRVTKTMPCPQCRTAVSPGVAKCVHCNAALLTKPCRDCGELAYVGHV